MAKVERVLIVGGGIGGLCAAIALRTAGFDAEVFEQAPELREVGAGVGLWSNALESLDQLGVGDEIRRASRPLRTMAGANSSGKTLTSLDLDELGPDFAQAACHVVLRPTLLAALARRLPAAAVRTGRRAIAFEDGVLRFDDGAIEKAQLVVGADGLHSAIRAYVVGPDEVRYSGQTCFRGVAKVRPPEPGTLREVQGAGQRGSVCPIDPETVYWWAAYNAPRATMVPIGERRDSLLERYRGWPFGLPDAISATPNDAILQNDLVDRVPARRYVAGRVVLVGDAAHPTTPNLGQGANMAIDDAIVLARALRQEPDLETALVRYERERLSRATLVVQRSWTFGRMCTWQSGLAVGLRDMMVRMTPARVMRDMLRWQILDSVGRLEDGRASTA